MEITNLKNLSISNLILIILNDKNNDILRKYAEVELKHRIQNVGWYYEELLHFDDKVIKQRGLNVNDYLISPNVNMQQLMEAYFLYDWKADYESNYLLFSEKHLCNEANFAAPFFSKICSKEIKNLDKRIENIKSSNQKEILLTFKKALEDREERITKEKKQWFKEDPIEALGANEAFCQLDGDMGLCHEFMMNYSNEKMYRHLNSKLGRLKLMILDNLNDTLFDPDLVQNLCGLRFVTKDSSKLNLQKRRLLNQVNSGFEVDYNTEPMQKALTKIKK